MKLTVPPLPISEDEGFTPEKDIFQRKGFGERLMNLVVNTDDELVVALDAPWGEGKTTFIKMWQGLLRQNDIKSIYFDAFANDYQKDAFLAIAAEIYSLIEDEDGENKAQFKRKAIAVAKTLGRAGLRVGVKAATFGAVDDTFLEDIHRDVEKEASDLLDNFVESRLENTKQDKKNLESFKEFLGKLATHFNEEKPLVFIIDELDRCKPPFALEILENIKHLYSIPNVVFVLVMNRRQIEESVRCEYGLGVDASKYLQKFINIWIYFSKNRYAVHQKLMSSRFIRYCLKSVDLKLEEQTEKNLIEVTNQLINLYQLSLREIERLISDLAILCAVVNAEELFEDNIKYLTVSVYLSIVRTLYPMIYEDISNSKIGYNKLVESTRLNELAEQNPMPGYIGGHRLNFLLFCDVANDKEVRKFSPEDPRLIEGYRDVNRVEQVCQILNSFSVDV